MKFLGYAIERDGKQSEPRPWDYVLRDDAGLHGLEAPPVPFPLPCGGTLIAAYGQEKSHA
jgi:hypothetical protein